jgi:two-component sensor histidine kinase
LVTIDFEVLFTRSPNSYVVLDDKLRLIWMNDAYLRVTMRKREDIIGKGLFEAFPNDPESAGRKLLEGSLKKVLQTGEHDELALIRYDIAGSGNVPETRYWSATHTPFLDESGKVTHILQHTVDVTELQELRGLREEMGVIERASAVQERNLNLAREAYQFKALFEQAPGFISILHGPKHEFHMANAAYRNLVGGRDLVGRTVSEALPEVIDQGFGDLLDRVWSSRLPYVGHRVKIFLRNNEKEEPHEHYLDFIYQPITGSEGEMIGIFVQGQDVTRQVEAEQRQQLLMNELNHRVKNTLAIVQGLAMQSFRQLPGSDEARRTFNARLAALASAHDLLTTSNWRTAGFIDTVWSAVEATIGEDAHRLSLDGKDFMLPPQAAVSLAMIIHELCTNAVKYGSLSVPEGIVTVSWTVDDVGENCQIFMRWIESGGPPVKPPTRNGFGSRLISHGFSTERGSKVEMNFLPSGLECTVAAQVPKGLT